MNIKNKIKNLDYKLLELEHNRNNLLKELQTSCEHKEIGKAYQPESDWNDATYLWVCLNCGIHSRGYTDSDTFGRFVCSSMTPPPKEITKDEFLFHCRHDARLCGLNEEE